MTNQRISITVVGDAAEQLKALADKTADPRPALAKVAQDIRGWEADVFRTANGGKWDPLNPSTLKRHGLHQPLDLSGGLRRSLTSKGKGSVTRVRRSELYVGTSDPKAILQRSGAKGHPKRDPVPKPSIVAVNAWGKTLLDALLEGFGDESPDG